MSHGENNQPVKKPHRKVQAAGFEGIQDNGQVTKKDNNS
jgi:hypothetical protein